MSGSDDSDGRIWSAAHEAVLQFGALRFGQMVAKTIWHLRRHTATGIWGDGYRYRTLWDEYCHEVQEGPHDEVLMSGLPDLSSAFDMTIRPFLEQLIDRLPLHEAILLTFHAIAEADEEDQVEIAGRIDREAMIERLAKTVCQDAADADLWKFRD